MGIDSVVIMRDVCGIEDDKEALEVLRWTAFALLEAARRDMDVSYARNENVDR